MPHGWPHLRVIAPTPELPSWTEPLPSAALPGFPIAPPTSPLVGSPLRSYTRFAAYLQPAYYADSVIKKQLHKFLLPFKRAIWNYFREAVPPLIAAPGALHLVASPLPMTLTLDSLTAAPLS